MINLVVKTVRVSRKHIDKGHCGNTEKCAVAQALADVSPGYLVTVDGESAVYRSPGLDGSAGQKLAQIDLPRPVRQFIARFDGASLDKYGFGHGNDTRTKARKAKLQPFTFVTAVPAL